jgi:hypothetical protein
LEKFVVWDLKAVVLILDRSLAMVLSAVESALRPESGI